MYGPRAWTTGRSGIDRFLRQSGTSGEEEKEENFDAQTRLTKVKNNYL